MYNPAERWKRDTLAALLGQTLASVLDLLQVRYYQGLCGYSLVWFI